MSTATSSSSRPTMARAVNETFQATNRMFAMAEELVHIAQTIEDPDQKTEILNVATGLAQEAQNVIRSLENLIDAAGRIRSW